MSAPSGACASVPTKVPSASRRVQRGRPGVKRAPTDAASVARIVTALTILFPNSMNEW